MKNKLLELLMQNRDNFVERKPQDVYKMVSQRTGVPEEDVAAIGGVESTHGKYQDNPRSQAKGLFQLMPSVIAKLKPEGVETPKDLGVQEDVMVDLLEESLKKLPKKSLQDLYLKHNLGLGNAKKMMLAGDKDSVEQLLPSKIVKGNPEFFKNKKVGEAKELIDLKLKKALDEYNPELTLEDLLK
jgi:hypothetical protein